MMRRTHRTLILALAFALPMWAVASASGAPEKDCDDRKWENHPVCQTATSSTTLTTAPTDPPGHPPGLSCAEADWAPVLIWDLDEWIQGTVRTVTLTESDAFVCIDLLNSQPVILTIEVTDPGGARLFTANVRDSHPGDKCSDTHFLDLKKSQPPWTMKLGESGSVYDRIPAATVNACGTEYSEADLDAAGNVIFETFEQTGEPDPIAFAFGYMRSGPTTVQLSITYEIYEPAGS